MLLNYCPFVLPAPSRSVLGMPDTVEEMCPDVPPLERLMREINHLAESGARYTEMPHVIEVILPMLCNYLSYWWEQGPEHLPPSAGPWCTQVTSEHLSVTLGNILKIINNNLAIDEASWMKRIAGTAVPFSPAPGSGPGGPTLFILVCFPTRTPNDFTVKSAHVFPVELLGADASAPFPS